jgi:hypothetical protein
VVTTSTTDRVSSFSERLATRSQRRPRYSSALTLRSEWSHPSSRRSRDPSRIRGPCGRRIARGTGRFARCSYCIATNNESIARSSDRIATSSWSVGAFMSCTGRSIERCGREFAPRRSVHRPHLRELAAMLSKDRPCRCEHRPSRREFAPPFFELRPCLFEVGLHRLEERARRYVLAPTLSLHRAMRCEIGPHRGEFAARLPVIGLTRSELLTETRRALDVTVGTRGASVRARSATARVRRVSVRMTSDAVRIRTAPPRARRDAVAAPCDAPGVRRDAVRTFDDSLGVPCDALCRPPSSLVRGTVSR